MESIKQLQRGFSKALSSLNDSFEKLSSGKRINKAKDDAAGLAIAEALLAENRTLAQGSRNGNDVISALSIADSAMGQVSDVTTRLSELATQASNGALSDSQRQSLAAEFNALKEEVGRIEATTEFNGVKLLQGENSITAQIGTDSSASSQIKTPSVQLGTSALQSLDISSIDSARNAIEAVKSFSSNVSSTRGELGATASRIESALSNNDTRRIGTAEAESRIRDADIAEESSQKIKGKILADSNAALQAQAGKINRNVLRFLE